MPNELDPIVGQWYEQRDQHELFEVIAVEKAADIIEMQTFDGAIGAVDLESWRDMDLALAEPPEDWTGPYDDIENEDLGYSSDVAALPDWRTSLDAQAANHDSWADLDFDQTDTAGSPSTSAWQLPTDNPPR